MLMFKERRPTIRALRGWAISVLQEVGAIRECEEHGWIQDRADPRAGQRRSVPTSPFSSGSSAMMCSRLVTTTRPM
jgi:hypothetical protein